MEQNQKKETQNEDIVQTILRLLSHPIGSGTIGFAISEFLHSMSDKKNTNAANATILSDLVDIKSELKSLNKEVSLLKEELKKANPLPQSLKRKELPYNQLD